MPEFKITHIEGTKATGKYLSEEKIFEFKNQSSEPLPSFTMFKGTQVEIEFDAVKTDIKAGDVTELEGSWYNFTKRKPVPEMIFCVTKVISVI